MFWLMILAIYVILLFLYIAFFQGAKRFDADELLEEEDE